MRPTQYKRCISIFIILFSVISFAVKGQMGQIKGRIVDANSQEPLPYGNVFINHTTIGTAANANGDFMIDHVPYGQSELIISYVGYQSAQLKVQMDRNLVDVGRIKIAPQDKVLQTVEVKATRDKKWERQLGRFKKIFFGDGKLADQCTIENPWVLDFSDEEKGKQLTASAALPLEITNNALGYTLHFYLKDFWKNSQGYLIEGNVRFEELVAKNEAAEKTWKENRNSAYIGSSQQLLRAIVNHRIKGEGFYLYTDAPGKEHTVVRSPFFEQELKLNVIPYDTSNLVFPGDIPGTYKIVMPGMVEMHNHNERALVRTYRDIRHPVSWIRLDKDTIRVTQNGTPLNPTDVITSGDLDAERVAYMLPTNYNPEGTRYAEVAPALYENVYVQTDKPYYYPGETIWFKAYMRYADLYLHDSLSKVLYVELINEERKVVLSRMAEIGAGQASGEFMLTDSLSHGNYYLRAYTNWMRNFGEQNLFIKPIPVLGLTDRVDSRQALMLPSKGDISIQSNKATYATREKIDLSFVVHDRSGNPIRSFLSVSVTDASQVVPIPEVTIMAKGIPFNEINEKDTTGFEFPIEHGISFEARYFNTKHVPEKKQLALIEWNSHQVLEADADVAGFFKLSDLYYYDSAKFSLASTDKKEPDGTIEPLERKIPDTDFMASPLPIKLERTETPQRVLSAYELPEDVKLLEGVEIQGKKIDNTRMLRPYGIVRDVDIIPEKQIKKAQDLNYSLAGQVPGLSVELVAPGTWRIINTRTGGSPMVTVNDVPVQGLNAGDAITMLNPNTISSIEVTKFPNVLYGSQGFNGVIAVYTKDHMAGRDKIELPDLPFIKEPGFAPLLKFKAPQYDQKVSKNSETDFRSTLYWNPDVITDPDSGTASVSFFAADLETTYRIVVEGITEYNDPVWGEYYVTVKSK